MEAKDMSRSLIGLCLLIFVVTAQGEEQLTKKESHPPHCTYISKVTDYESKYKFDYPLSYIPQGQHEAYQQLYCVNPSAVNKALTTVCDWAAPPQVQFTLGDEFMHVVRVDPTGRFLGSAVITTQQFCSHNHINNETEINIFANEIESVYESDQT